MSTKSIVEEKPNFFEKTVSVMALWIARLVIATLAVAGGLTLLSGIDDLIKYPTVAVLVAFLLKETM